jgi:hypothetical protein
MQTTLDLTADIIDIRDIIARIEELAEDLTTYSAETRAHPEWAEEHAALCTIMRDLKGCGGDEQWEGDWYPVTLIADGYFTEYVQELLEDCGDIPKNLPDYIVIDWEQTARIIRTDYSAIEIRGSAYWYR